MRGTGDATEYPMSSWAVSQVIRWRGGVKIVEDVCEHGVAHPNRAWFLGLSEEDRDYMGIHGCCKGRCCCRGP